MIQLILNADDFGRSSFINEAVMKAHRQGVLTSASLMVSGEAVDEAVELSKQVPNLAMGLHLVLIGGRAVLPPRDIPDLVDQNGFFSKQPVSAGLRYFLSPKVQKQLALEMDAQFDRFSKFNLKLTHVNGHVHMHLHPTIFKLMLTLADQYNVKGIRLPRDDLWESLAWDKQFAGTKIMWAVIFGSLSYWAQKRLKRFTITHGVYGLMQTGHMQEGYVLRLLHKIKVPSAEIYFHPSTQSNSEPLGPNPGDLKTLVNPELKEVIQRRGLILTDYANLKKDINKHG